MPSLRKSFFAAVLISATALSPIAASAETILGALSKAYQNNSSLNSARAGVRVTDEGVPIAKSGYRPTITGQADVDYQTRTSAAPNSNGLSTAGVGIVINQTLFDGFQTKNNVAAAESQVSASVESLRNTEENTLFNAASAYMDVIRDRQVAVLTEQNLQFLTEQARAARSRFEVGEGTRTDVAQADASRSSAVAQLSAARAQALASAATYHQIVGDEPGKLKARFTAGEAFAIEPRCGDHHRVHRASGHSGHPASGRCGGVFGEIERRRVAAAAFRLGRCFPGLSAP